MVQIIKENKMSNKIINIENIKKVLSEKRKSGKKIVQCHGVFDLLHIGHIRHFKEAKSFGDVLVIGLNSDNSVKKLKGDYRPINSQENRAIVLAALESVDYVIIFEEDTPYNLINLIQPDLLIKGGDYKGKEVIGSDLVKEVRLVKFIDKMSTSNTIKKIQNL